MNFDIFGRWLALCTHACSVHACCAHACTGVACTCACMSFASSTMTWFNCISMYLLQSVIEVELKKI